jgi:hypothetical protein
MGRKFRFAEEILVLLVEGTKARIDAVLEPGEDRSGFVRLAIKLLIAQRDRAKAKGKEKG